MSETAPLKHIDSVSEDVAGKLLKMVALANDARNEERQGEFEAAMEAAVRYSQRHNIDLATVDPDKAGRTQSITSEPFLNKIVQTAKGNCRRPPACKWIVAILCRHFNVEIVYGGSKYNSSKMWIIGRKSHVEFAEYAFFFLVKQFSNFWRSYKNRHGCLMSDRASYYYGFWMGLDSKLTKAQNEGRQEIIRELSEKSDLTDTAEQTFTLAVINERAALKQAMGGYHPVLKKGTGDFFSGVDTSSSCVYGGRQDGEKCTIHRPLENGSKKDLKDATELIS